MPLGIGLNNGQIIRQFLPALHPRDFRMFQKVQGVDLLKNAVIIELEVLNFEIVDDLSLGINPDRHLDIDGRSFMLDILFQSKSLT
ncbi:MAG: hypothetical protein KJ727_04290 [Acidobacteria bacterium]|nr:hypothetical protein [Acidobacteriota bacterium]